MNKNNQTLAFTNSLLIANKRVLNVPELSQLTGISISWIYKLCQQRKIPHSKPGGKLIMFDKEAVQNWLLSNPVQPVDGESEALSFVANNPLKGGLA